MTADLPKKIVTDAQGRILSDIVVHGQPRFGVRSSSGGAINRMISRMRNAGWIVGYWNLTDAGAAALETYQARLVKRERRYRCD
jgi:hypothetical protein